MEDLRSQPRSLAEALEEAEKRHSSLESRLSYYRDQTRRLRPDFTRVYDELVERLDVLDRGEVGPKVGERLPEFALPDQTGRLVSLSSLLEAGPAVISLNRGHWCPYCKLELRSLAAIHGEIRRLGAQLVTIMPDTAQFTGGYAEKNALPFPVLSDIDLGYSLSLGLVFWVGTEIARMYEEAGLELEKYQNNPGLLLPISAKFIVDRDGVVAARHVNIEFRERMEPEAVVAALKALHTGR